MHNKRDLTLPPATSQNLNNFYKLVFEPLSKGESNAVIGIPKSGTRGFSKFFMELRESGENKYTKGISDINFFFIDLDKNEEILALEIKKIFKQVVKCVNKGNRIVILVNNADKLLVNASLFSRFIDIYNLNAMQVKFLLIINREVEELGSLKLLSKLGISEFKYIPLRGDADIEILVNNEEIWNTYKVDSRVREKVVRLSGGYSALARALLSIGNSEPDYFLGNSNAELSQNPKISNWFELLYDSLGAKSKLALNQYLLGVPLQGISLTQYLYHTGGLTVTSMNLKIFSPLFKEWLLTKLVANPEIDFEGVMIKRNGIDVRSILSNQEYLALRLLISKRGKIVSKEDISKAIWFDDWSQKYSDWALDKLIFSIRKKLLLDKSFLINVRKKGYLLKDQG